VATNEATSATNNLSTNAALAAINEVLNLTNSATTATNSTGLASTNAAGTNVVTAVSSNKTGKAAKPKKKSKKRLKLDAEGHEILMRPEHMGLFIGLVILSGLGLGTLAAYDISQFMGNRALKVIYNDNLEGMKDPDYDEAEAEWTNGNHLEAIRMMREYLKKNPREQHAALRIAEIYEKDLNNYLAAALEYEEVLTKKLAPERWGWAAIHLCNLYFKLDKEDKAVALLKRIDTEYGQTAAAEKARKRLEQMNIPTSVDAAAAEAVAAEEAAAASKAVEEDKGPKLPPGFTLKKR
jgi:TolA-binding protein